MADFEALIKARLDTGGVDQDIKSIEGKQVTLRNFRLETGSLISSLQSELSKHKFNITIDTGRIGQSGAQAANAFSKSFNAGMGGLNTTTNNAQNTIAHMQRTLASMKFDRSSINAVTKDLESMNLSIQNVTTRINNRSLNMRISGVDELGRAVTIVKEFDHESGRVVSVGKTISQSFGESASAVRKFEADVKTAMTAMETNKLGASIDKVKLSFEGIANTGHASLSQIRADIETLSTLQNNMANSTSDEALVAGYKEFEQVLARVKNQITEVSAQSRTMASGLQIDTLDNKMAVWLERNSRAARDFGSGIADLRSKLATLKSSGNATTSQLKSIEVEFMKIKQQALAAGKVGVSFGQSLKGAFASLTRYISISTIIYQGIAALKQMYQNVYDIDTEMTELKKVTDETASSYKNFLDSAGQSSQQIGTTIKDLVSSTADFARLGYSFTDSQDLAKVANMYNVVGDEIDGIDEATKSVISTMAAFNSEMDATMGNGEFAMSIIDKFNEVGNNFAISSGGIGEALTRSASSMAAANNTLDETIALITAANTVVQNPESIGTAYKTISMRIRGAKTELEEAGLETDGMVESTAKLREEIMALSGVDIMLDENTFKSTYQIMKELAGEWEHLTDIQQASITELIAGKRQGNIVSALMSNFDIAENALKTSINSEGSAAAEHAKWMDSMEAKTKQFQAAWENLSQHMMSSDFLKGLVDTGTGFLNILDSISQHIGALPLAAAGTGLALFIKNFG